PPRRPHKLGLVLRFLGRVAPAAAVADRDIEVPVGTELQAAAVVVPELRMADDALAPRPAKVEPRPGIGHERVPRRSLEARDDDVAVGIVEKDVETSADRGVWWEGHSQEPALAAG